MLNYFKTKAQKVKIGMTPEEIRSLFGILVDTSSDEPKKMYEGRLGEKEFEFKRRSVIKGLSVVRFNGSYIQEEENTGLKVNVSFNPLYWKIIIGAIIAFLAFVVYWITIQGMSRDVLIYLGVPIGWLFLLRMQLTKEINDFRTTLGKKFEEFKTVESNG